MSKAIGNEAEKKALEYLSQKGFRVLFQNFSTPLGEIDLIGLVENTLIFVEVKYRASDLFGSALEMVGYQKQQKLKKTAASFLQKHKQYQSLACRFDVVAITANQIEWVKGAFE